ncbi:MAG: 2-isopropylmalate synthase [Prevotellaceae bacterium]|jgi:D-citramalate synthase|nr:2-isopropylmalate synthase [Prevotellaceae bacterium]
MQRIEIIDTTLRDGEQTSGVSFAAPEKLHIVRLLIEDLRVDHVEIASAKVSDGEFETVRRVTKWAEANHVIEKIEVLGFVDGDKSLAWVKNAGCRVMNLLCKGSLKHCTGQLRKTPEQHLADIQTVLDNAAAESIGINVYFEDWSNGMNHSPDYVFFLADHLKNKNIRRFMLPDTLGILNPTQTAAFCRTMVARYPDLYFDFHAHNDYDLAVANIYEAAKAGIKGIHVTINGLGERAGNAPLSSVVAVLHDQLKLPTNIREDKINAVSRAVESYSGIRIPANKPVVGEHVFTQVAGVHADGDNKNKLYYNDLLPERFGRERLYALGKNSGKANVLKNLENLNMELDEDTMRKVTERIIELGDKKEVVTPDDLPYIVSDVLKSENVVQKVKLLNYSLSISKGLKPIANIGIEIGGESYRESAVGDGQYDAFMKALWTIYDRTGKPHPVLEDYNVGIPPGGRTDALVQTVITWNMNGNVFKTSGLDGDQTEAAIKATVKMLNIIENK